MTITADAPTTTLTVVEANDLKDALGRVLGPTPDVHEVLDLAVTPAFQRIVARHAEAQVAAAKADADAVRRALFASEATAQDLRLRLDERADLIENTPPLPTPDSITRLDDGTVEVITGSTRTLWGSPAHALQGASHAYAAYDDFLRQAAEKAAAEKARADLIAEIVAASQQAGRTPDAGGISAVLDALGAAGFIVAKPERVDA